MANILVILGFGLVGKSIYTVLKDMISDDRIIVISKRFLPYTEEKNWYIMAESNLVNSDQFPTELKKYLGNKIYTKYSYIGEYSNIYKYEEVYRKKTIFFPRGSSKRIGFRKYIFDKKGNKQEGKIVKTKIYGFGDWARIVTPSCEYFTGDVMSVNVANKTVTVQTSDDSNETVIQYDVLINTLPLTVLEEKLGSESLNNCDIDKEIGKILENCPVYMDRRTFVTDEFLSSMRRYKLFGKYILEKRFKVGDHLVIFDFDANSQYYKHIVYRAEEEIFNVYSLSINHSNDFLSYKINDPGRIRCTDQVRLSEYLEALRKNSIFSMGRYGVWDGGRRVIDDMRYMLKNASLVIGG